MSKLKKVSFVNYRKIASAAMLLCIAVSSTQSLALNVNVNLFSTQSISALAISHVSGKYIVRGGTTEIMTMLLEDTVRLEVQDDNIILKYKGKIIAFSDRISFEGIGFDNVLSLKIGENKQFVMYDDDVYFSIRNGGMFVVNSVDFEKYVAAVVQAEAGGSSDNLEFFKAHAIVSRTYAGRILMTAGKNTLLTDDVSNQVYKGKCLKGVILESVEATQGEIIVYDDSLPINAVFHSNSGGYTISSADVWLASLPYLQPVADSFSLVGKNSEWTASTSVLSWLNYLNTVYEFPIHIDSMRTYALNFTQETRVKDFYKGIPLKNIRSDMKFKSTFFSITSERDVVTFKGRGYGHGVGFAQEGAAQMAEKEFKYDEIIKFYYEGVDIINFSEKFATL